MLPEWSAEFTDHDWHLVAAWNPGWSLTDVLANYDMCDLFARYLVENGAGRGTYHAALFGYCFLNDVQYLDAGAQPSRFAIQAMFDAACRHLAASFEAFAAEMRAAVLALVIRQPIVVALDCGAARWQTELAHAGQLGTIEHSERLDGVLAAAFRTPGIESTMWESELGSVKLAYHPPAFRLTALLDESALAAGNAAVLDSLGDGENTCYYQQLDQLVVLHGARSRNDPIMSVVRLCRARRYGGAAPGTIERAGRRGRREHFVVHSPAGTDPAAVRALVSARFGPCRFTDGPLRAEGSLRAKGSLRAEGTLRAEGSLRAEDVEFPH